MSAIKAAFDSFKSLYTADTGSGGLNESAGSGAAKVHQFFRSRDWAAASAVNRPLPHIRVDVILPRNDAVGIDRVNGIIRLTLVGEASRDEDKMDVIDTRMEALFHASTPTASGWSITKPTLIRQTWLANQGERARLLHEYRFKACAS